ncbi:dnaJ homolog subfamily C member 24 [Rana temporaria]|uniref:dnaJ homolog subfamily C member 24 n=1 Tax=Rana temporaria TaxID=8407 RepID=UPI001AADC0FF|nr:dnaJ homolog subfamily C member 24 [Rana temporaria]XP_040184263.1 dnaJ homolog subfamily C member 24 [Rana temporaria]XP_040184264.1 dnaJ homolog subfamily C member 24 [Rana temporaria]
MASNSATQKDWYCILGAHPSDSQSELKQKYQKLALLYHPDKQNKEEDIELTTEGAHKFIEISQAWKILGNEETKREYDLQRRETEMTRSYHVDNQVSLEEMEWEDDMEFYCYTCRCGGKYSLTEEDLEQSLLVNCDSCSLIIEVYRNSRHLAQ